MKHPDSLPEEVRSGHHLCFFLHDALAQLLVSAEASGTFRTQIEFMDLPEAALFEQMGLQEWLDRPERRRDRARVAKLAAFPAVLSDALHNIYEALTCARKAKLAVAFTLLRKPLQENLFVLESMLIDEMEFTRQLAGNPLLLRAQRAGGPSAHETRISRVLEAMSETARFDAAYLAQLRYTKCVDGFDGICNLAIHLFTEHQAIRTAPMNMNFIFSNDDDRHTQWRFLYSRLPYVLAYFWCVVETIMKGIALTAPGYEDELKRRFAAYVYLWKGDLPFDVLNDALVTFIDATRSGFVEHMRSIGARPPTHEEFVRLAETGALPGESARAARRRLQAFQAAAETVRRSRTRV